MAAHPSSDQDRSPFAPLAARRGAVANAVAPPMPAAAHADAADVARAADPGRGPPADGAVRFHAALPRCI